MKYKNIQFIAYVLNTGFGQQDGRAVYLGLEDPALDIKARCALMKRAMDTALARASTAPDTLKVFMAPEFFFRGNTGAYALADVVGNAKASADAVSVVSTLQAMAAESTWENWIFAFGSIVASSAPEDASAPIEVYNLTLVQAGGPENEGEQGARVVLKEWMSGIDFITRPAPPTTVPPPPAGMLYLDMVRHLTPASGDWFSTSDRLNYAVGSDTQQRNDDGSGIFTSAGVTFGLEICLDHLQKRLLTAQLPGAPAVQVQLVPSCGMWLQNTSIMTGPGGMVFACDGLGHGSSAVTLTATGASKINAHMTPVDDADLDPGQGAAAVPVASLFPGTTMPDNGAGPVQPPPGPDAPAGGVFVYDVKPIPVPAQVPGQLQFLTWTVPEGEIQFALVYGGNGQFLRAFCRMLSPTCQLNRFWYVIPPKAGVTMPGIDGNGKAGKITMALVGGSARYDYAIQCDAALGAFRFHGVALEFTNNINMIAPATVGMTQVPAPSQRKAP